ncbi:unnamed protein product [Darwinula stevensoni]|uniref:Phospholipid scramblase n=1 Tax=Darwinula stevensoni TaxID=69355 RepID=A0A7R8X4A0_9CRUS|nr:unnamed protein product [Darwinula stevensoni]CAG0885209.1 unnamed protein product [Darwinula stevensoni]
MGPKKRTQFIQKLTRSWSKSKRPVPVVVDRKTYEDPARVATLETAAEVLIRPLPGTITAIERFDAHKQHGLYVNTMDLIGYAAQCNTGGENYQMYITDKSGFDLFQFERRVGGLRCAGCFTQELSVKTATGETMGTAVQKASCTEVHMRVMDPEMIIGTYKIRGSSAPRKGDGVFFKVYDEHERTILGAIQIDWRADYPDISSPCIFGIKWLPNLIPKHKALLLACTLALNSDFWDRPGTMDDLRAIPPEAKLALQTPEEETAGSVLISGSSVSSKAKSSGAGGSRGSGASAGKIKRSASPPSKENFSVEAEKMHIVIQPQSLRMRNSPEGLRTRRQPRRSMKKRLTHALARKEALAAARSRVAAADILVVDAGHLGRSLANLLLCACRGLVWID